MENKHVGYLILGISALIVLIVLLFNNAMKKIITQGCPLMAGQGIGICPAYGTINQQTYLALGIVGLLIIVGLVLVFSKPNEKIIIKRIEGNKKVKLNTSELSNEEKIVLERIQNNKAIFQAELIEKTGFGKAKITRILDRLEGRGFVERKRRGMTNVVVLKE